jgi:hypothetical protein
MRLVEMECKFNNYAGTEFGPLVTSSVLAMESNYGLAGRAFMKNCYEHPQIVDEIVKQAYAFAQKNLNVSEERFWICGLGMVLAVGKAVKDQGLIDYDLDYMESWILDYLLPKMRSQVWSGLQGTTDILVTFLNEHIDSTLTLTEPIDMDGNPVGKVIINQIPRNTLRIRIDRTDRRVYINRKYLDSWLINNRFSISAFQAGLIKQKIFDPVDGIGYVALGQGTVYNTGVNVCYKLDVQNLSDLPGDDTIT